MISLFFFFFNDTATTEIYTLSLHDALPIGPDRLRGPSQLQFRRYPVTQRAGSLQATGTHSVPGPLSDPFGHGWAVAAPTTVGLDLPHDRRRMAFDPPADHRPGRRTIFDQREGDLLAFRQGQRRAWHG